VSRIESIKQEIVDFILKTRNRQRIADAAGLHLNTVSALVNGHSDNCKFTTLVKLEKAMNELKRGDNWAYRGGNEKSKI